MASEPKAKLTADSSYDSFLEALKQQLDLHPSNALARVVYRLETAPQSFREQYPTAGDLAREQGRAVAELPEVGVSSMKALNAALSTHDLFPSLNQNSSCADLGSAMRAARHPDSHRQRALSRVATYLQNPEIASLAISDLKKPAVRELLSHSHFGKTSLAVLDQYIKNHVPGEEVKR